ncbi:hypothetical protein [Bifidobacterium choloepi]|uniref:Uncharacterized protein n=1 Tax=Bifidobacterium choloepi TaxID=2614131 RepID=A0A6I5NNI8_9BIFI|nr:hypothetical protein [Bifidobacterium choloepi]NEG70282.1 hypothetical protein [Bifidobacterium choloepi]
MGNATQRVSGILQYLILLVAAVAVGVGCALVDAKSSPVLWYALWVACVVCILIDVVLEWTTKPRWSSIVSILVLYVPSWVSIWLCSWGYLPDEALAWIVLAGIAATGAIQAIAYFALKSHKRLHERPMRNGTAHGLPEDVQRDGRTVSWK